MRVPSAPNRVGKVLSVYRAVGVRRCACTSMRVYNDARCDIATRAQRRAAALRCALRIMSVDHPSCMIYSGKHVLQQACCTSICICVRTTHTYVYMIERQTNAHTHTRTHTCVWMYAYSLLPYPRAPPCPTLVHTPYVAGIYIYTASQQRVCGGAAYIHTCTFIHTQSVLQPCRIALTRNTNPNL